MLVDQVYQVVDLSSESDFFRDQSQLIPEFGKDSFLKQEVYLQSMILCLARRIYRELLAEGVLSRSLIRFLHLTLKTYLVHHSACFRHPLTCSMTYWVMRTSIN